jgi:hypothetical protein
MFSAKPLTKALERRVSRRPAFEGAVIPPLLPIAAGGLSGRPRCRIFPAGPRWVLQLETTSGWVLGNGPEDPPTRLIFLTLSAAVVYAELHGFDYRIIRAAPLARISDHRVGAASKKASQRPEP